MLILHNYLSSQFSLDEQGAGESQTRRWESSSTAVNLSTCRWRQNHSVGGRLGDTLRGLSFMPRVVTVRRSICDSYRSTTGARCCTPVYSRHRYYTTTVFISVQLVSLLHSYSTLYQVKKIRSRPSGILEQDLF